MTADLDLANLADHAFWRRDRMILEAECECVG